MAWLYPKVSRLPPCPSLDPAGSFLRQVLPRWWPDGPQQLLDSSLPPALQPRSALLLTCVLGFTLLGPAWDHATPTPTRGAAKTMQMSSAQATPHPCKLTGMAASPGSHSLRWAIARSCDGARQRGVSASRDHGHPLLPAAALLKETFL